MSDVFIDGNRNVPGCVCTAECEMPCWQRVGLPTEPCCEGCPALPYDVDEEDGDA